MVSLLAIAMAKYSNLLRFADFMAVLGNSKYLKIYSKEQKFIDRFDGFLFVNLALSMSIFLFYTYSVFVSQLTFELVPFLKLILAVATIMLIKTLLERLIGSLFEIDSIIDRYVFQKTTFKNYTGFVFLVANLLLLYTSGYHKIIIVITICVVFLINMVGFLTSFKSYQKTINLNLFYFLLYLCALEIAPYVLLYKAITDYNT